VKKNTQAEYTEFGTQDGQNVTRTGRIDRDAIVGLAVTGQAVDGAITVDATTAG
jgi:hypothetical protein